MSHFHIAQTTVYPPPHPKFNLPNRQYVPFSHCPNYSLSPPPPPPIQFAQQTICSIFTLPKLQFIPPQKKIQFAQQKICPIFTLPNLVYSPPPPFFFFFFHFFFSICPTDNMSLFHFAQPTYSSPHRHFTQRACLQLLYGHFFPSDIPPPPPPPPPDILQLSPSATDPAVTSPATIAFSSEVSAGVNRCQSRWHGEAAGGSHWKTRCRLCIIVGSCHK